MVFLLASVGAWSQNYITKEDLSRKNKKRWHVALQEMKSGQMEAALKKLKEIDKNQPNCLDVHLQQAAIYQQQKHTHLAINHLQKVIFWSPGFFPKAHLSLGALYLEIMDYKPAIESLHRFIQMNIGSKDLLKRAKHLKRLAEVRDTLFSNPVEFHPERLPSTINSTHLEYLAAITAEGEMIFTRRINGNEDLYHSAIDSNGKWQESRAIPEFQSDANEAAHCISADGKFLIFTGCDYMPRYRGCDLYVSRRIQGKWSNPVNLGPIINSPAWDSQPSLSADGKTLFFSSDRSGGHGGRDIWFTKFRGGKWSNPQNAGPTVNTFGNEETPCLHFDGQTLYFASDGHPGMGKSDLFVTKMKSGHWSSPENLGYPINTPDVEAALFVSLNGEIAYFSSDQDTFGNTQRQLDLFQFELPADKRPIPTTYAKISMLDASNQQPVLGRLNLIDLETNDSLYSLTTKGSTQILCLPVGTTYALHIAAPNYTIYSESFNLDTISTPEKPYELTILLHPLSSIMNDSIDSPPIVLKNLFFATGSADILPKSMSELDYLFNFLEKNPQVHIQIRGHTDNVGSKMDNQVLSTRRAKAVFDFLIAAGISESRLAFAGFGESHPIDSNHTPEGRANNRRTEFVIIKEGL